MVRAAVALLAPRARGALAFSAVCVMLWPLASDALAQQACPRDGLYPPKALMTWPGGGALTLSRPSRQTPLLQAGEAYVDLVIEMTPADLQSRHWQ
jgi:hypothetical protein